MEVNGLALTTIGVPINNHDRIIFCFGKLLTLEENLLRHKCLLCAVKHILNNITVYTNIFLFFFFLLCFLRLFYDVCIIYSIYRYDMNVFESLVHYISQLMFSYYIYKSWAQEDYWSWNYYRFYLNYMNFKWYALPI